MSEENQSAEEMTAPSSTKLNKSVELSSRDRLAKKVYSSSKATFFLGIIALVMTGLVVAKSFEVAPVYYIGSDSQSQAHKDQIPLDSVGVFSQAFLYQYYNFGPGNAEDVMLGVLPKFSPKIQDLMKSRIARSIEKIKDLGLEQQLILLGDVKVEKVPGQNIYRVSQKGKVKQWARQRLILEEDRRYDLVLERGVPTPKNSYGLYVYSEKNRDWGAKDDDDIREGVRFDSKAIQESARRLEQQR
jgi:hypothetical protein